MHRQAIRWSMRRTLTAAAPLLAVFLMACPMPAPPINNDNENGDPPPPQPTPVDVTIVPVGGGTVEQDIGDTSITLTAVPADGWSFDGWSGADVPDDNPLTVAGGEITAITANFVEDAPPPPPDADGDGVPDAQDTCANTPAGEDVDDNGCAAGQLDSDDDGVTDDVDECPTTPAGINVDEVGCPVSDPGTADDDGDGVANDIDQCPDTPAGATVDANGCVDSDGDGISDAEDDCADTPAGADVGVNGCAASQLDSDADGVTDDIDLCPDTPRGQAVDASGCPTGGGNGGGTDPLCGDDTLDAGEECDDGNTDDGDGCGGTCLNEPSDDCGDVRSIDLGTRSYSTEGATTDGPEETDPNCALAGDTQIGSDVWYCFTSTCEGRVVVSACGAAYDAKMAVYAGCGCPTGSSIACSDDDCGAGSGPRLEFSARTGDSYMIRIGGYTDERGTAQGTGTITIFCADDANHDVTACGPGAGDCFSANGSTACDDVDCCVTTCEVDPFCCDTDWDSLCADKADGLCGDGFDSCGPGAGDCAAAAGNGSPGCESAVCCQAVCERDPYCCLTEWDEICAEDAEYTCTPLEVCANATGDCLTGNDTPGCNVQSCCETVCFDDPACCDGAWSASCADRAALKAECN